MKRNKKAKKDKLFCAAILTIAMVVLANVVLGFADGEDTQVEDENQVLPFKVSCPKPDEETGTYTIKPTVIIEWNREFIDTATDESAQGEETAQEEETVPEEETAQEDESVQKDESAQDDENSNSETRSETLIEKTIRYQLINEDVISASGFIDANDYYATIAPDCFTDGENILTVWLETTEKTYVIEDEICTETEAKEPEKSYTESFIFRVVTDNSDKAGDEQAKIEQDKKDKEKEEKAKEEKEKEEQKKKEEAKKEENKKPAPEKINAAPVITIGGVSPMQISRLPLLVQINFSDDTKIAAFESSVEYEDVNGHKSFLNGINSVNSDKSATESYELALDGYYRISAAAKDLEGLNASLGLTCIVDRTPPVISALEKLNGKTFKKFPWDKLPDGIVSDYSSFTVKAFMDNRIYIPGETSLPDGKHSFKIIARDAAGNESTREAVFTIDSKSDNDASDNSKDESKKNGIEDAEIIDANNPEGESSYREYEGLRNTIEKFEGNPKSASDSKEQPKTASSKSALAALVMTIIAVILLVTGFMVITLCAGKRNKRTGKHKMNIN
ncbi:MAG: hypothetical protein LBQ95_00220 [Lachnospiraceae bacterium]|jgi:hypothetical protein|nr:hypothetical protein [Lachnospiraceae bacterium]